MTNVGGNVFECSGRTSYTLIFGDLGPWIDAGGRPCYLASIDARGVLQRTVEPATAARTDPEPVAHFDLSPLVEPQTFERRCDAVRRQGERRASECGAGECGALDRRQGERRQPQRRRRVIWRAPNWRAVRRESDYW